MALAKRNEIDAKDKWKIEDLFESDKAWGIEYEKLVEELEKTPQYKTRLGESCEVLDLALREFDSIENKIERIYVYANQKYYEDTTNSIYQNLSGKAHSLLTMFYSKYSYQEPEILSMSEEVLKDNYKWQIENSIFATYLENLIRQKKHILSEELEDLMANASEVAKASSDIFSSFNNADLKFADIKDSKGNVIGVSHGKYTWLMENNDRTVRKNAFESIYTAYGAYKNSLASMYNSNVKQAMFFAKARKYNNTLEASLDNSNVPVEVYDNLIHTVNDNLPLMHRYVALRKKVLGLEKMHMYDVYAPLVEDVDFKADFEKARAIVTEGLKPLGEGYIDILNEGFENGWIDKYESEGKRSGAFSWGAYGTHPYVFLNYQGNLDSVFTTAHELGHAVHTYLSNANQPHIYSGYKIFVAEVASTCNEALLIRHMIEKNADDKKMKAYLINHFLEQFKGTMFRQTMFAEFEKITHGMAKNGITLTADVLCEEYRKLNVKYFGEDIVIDEEIGMEWARIPHFYTPFYVYQYATGFAAAVAISQKILAEGDVAVKGYIEFLKSGSSDYTIEVLKKAGVDMSKPDAIVMALGVFEKLLDEFEDIIQ